MEENREELQREVDAARSRARAAVARAKVSLPLLEMEWADWVTDHRAEFNAKMGSSDVDRRAFNKRLGASIKQPAPVKRLAPTEGRLMSRKTRDHWVELLWGRSGWFGMQLVTGRVVTVLLSHRRKQTWGVSVDHLAIGRGVFRIGDLGPLKQHVRPLIGLVPLHSAVSRVCDFCLTGGVVDGQVVLQVAHAAPVDSPLKTRAKRARSAADASDHDIASASSDEEAAESLGDVSSENSGVRLAPMRTRS